LGAQLGNRLKCGSYQDTGDFKPGRQDSGTFEDSWISVRPSFVKKIKVFGWRCFFFFFFGREKFSYTRAKRFGALKKAKLSIKFAQWADASRLIIMLEELWRPAHFSAGNSFFLVGGRCRTDEVFDHPPTELKVEIQHCSILRLSSPMVKLGVLAPRAAAPLINRFLPLTYNVEVKVCRVGRAMNGQYTQVALQSHVVRLAARTFEPPRRGDGRL